MSQAAAAKPRNRWISLAVLCTGQLMIILDQTIVNVALPSIQKDLGFAPTDLAWVVNAYAIAFGGLLLLAGRLGDLLGRRSVFVSGIALFTVGSLLCGISTSQGMLVGARFLQGIGGAVTAAGILGMIVMLFTDPEEQGKAIGVFSFASAGGGAIGPLIGGVLTQGVTWHWIFFINIPIGVVVAVSALRTLDKDGGSGVGSGADAVGALLVTVGLMLGVYAIEGAESAGWASAHTLGFAAVAVVLLVTFVIREAKAANPLLPLRMFRSGALSGANAVQALMVAGMFGFLYFGTLYLQQVMGWHAMASGFGFVPIAIAIGAVSLGLSARIISKFGARPVLLTGLALIALGFVVFSQVPTHGTFAVDVLMPQLLLGVGFGAAMPALMGLAMADVAPADSGVASGLFGTTQQIGGAIGLAALNSLATQRGTSLMAHGADKATALTEGFRLAFGISVGLLVAAILVAVISLRKHTAAAQAEDAGKPEDAPPTADGAPTAEGVPAATA